MGRPCTLERRGGLIYWAILGKDRAFLLTFGYAFVTICGMKSRMDEFAEWGTEVVFGRAKGFRAWMMRCALRVASFGFYALVKTRLFLFRRRIKTVHYLGTFVVSVGNITAGGTGKTPVVELLSRTLAERGRKCAILTRGYKSEELDQPQVWLDAEG